jgi:hypothetical protein
MTDPSANIAHDETERLIASNKVEGTAVYDRQGAKLGSIHNFMVEKRTGKVEYAVLNAGGGLLGGTRYYPLPWDVLTYDTGRGGYVVDLSPDQLKGAPSYAAGEDPRYDRDYDDRLRGHYRR